MYCTWHLKVFDCGIFLKIRKRDDFVMKRTRNTSTPAENKRKVTYVTFQKWKREFDKECKTVTWLDCESSVEDGTKVVRKLKCTVCLKFRSKILHKRNFSDRWLLGADSVRTSSIRDHARSEQHAHAMNLLEKERTLDAGQSLLANAPIALALNTMSNEEKIRLKHKFDIAYFLAIEKLSFRKFPCVCELEARHGVSIGSSYTTETAARSFTHFIAEAKRNQLVST